MHVVATAGHVDHGKTTLVKALTGIDADRLAEEKRRGLTIDLGFAWTALPSGREVAFVDVPGHIRFIKNMLAGVGAVDACLFVVAANEGWKPQSEEHLRILELLGISQGVVALTKVASTDADLLRARREQLTERLAGTFLAEAPVVEVDAVAQKGLQSLSQALDQLLAQTPRSPDLGRPRLWIDRVFVATGSGTVVTGTLTGGVIAVHDVLEVVGPSDSSVHGRGARVRGLQTHGHAAQEVGPGHRLALNLSGPSHDQLTRGQALVRSGQWQPTRTCDASLSVLAGTGHEVSQRGAYRAYFGSGQYTVRLRLLGSSPLLPGQTGLVRIHLPCRLPLLPGDRYVLREVGRSETVGGGEVLDVAPIVPAARARPDRSVDRVVQERGWIEAALLERLTGQRRPATVGCWVVDPEVLTETRLRLTRAVEEAGPLGLPLAGLSEQERAVLAETQGVDVREGRARPSGSESDSLAEHPFIDRLNSSPFAPPDPRTSGVGRVELRELVRRGYIVDCDGCYFSADAMEQAVAVTARLLSEHPDGVTTSEVRQALGTTRKFVLPLLAYFDHTGVTRRRGDRRVAGPRLPTSPDS